MELKLQCCSLELAKKLKELGVKQESAFKWFSVDTPSAETNSKWYLGDSTKDFPSETDELFSAFTVAELGEMLPEQYAVVKVTYGFAIFGKKDNLNYTMLGGHQISLPTDLSEADARAEMLIYLLVNKLIERS